MDGKRPELWEVSSEPEIEPEKLTKSAPQSDFNRFNSSIENSRQAHEDECKSVASTLDVATTIGEDEENEGLDIKEWKKSIRDCMLNEIQTFASSFSHQGLLSNAPNPGLLIDGHGTISFPLSNHDFELIVAASKQNRIRDSVSNSPYTKGPWSVPGDQVNITNPAWDTMVSEIAESLKVEMSLENKGFTTTLSSLVLYEAGSRTEYCVTPSPSAFGTLDIMLPSQGTGEVIYISDGDKEIRFSVGGTAWDCSFLSWFADVHLTNTPLVTGHRLVLRYSLQHTAAGTCSSAATLASSKKLETLLENFVNRPYLFEENCAWILDSEYGDQLSYKNLREHDRLVVSHLKATCEHLGLQLYLAHMDMETSGRSPRIEHDYDDDRYTSRHRNYRQTSSHGFSDDSDDTDDLDQRQEYCDFDTRYIVLDRVTALDGSFVCGPMSFGAEGLIQEDFGKYENPYKREYDQFKERLTCNFRRSVVIILPTWDRANFIMRFPGNRDAYIANFLKKLPKVPSDLSDDLKRDLADICGCVGEPRVWGSFPSAVSKSAFSSILTALVDMNQEVLFKQFLPAYFSTSEEISKLETMANRHGQQWLISMIESRLSGTEASRSFVSQCQAIDVVSRYHKDYEWSRTQYELAASSMKLNSVEDAEHLLVIAKTWDQQQIDEILIPAIRRIQTRTASMFTMLKYISKIYQSPDTIEHPFGVIFREIFLVVLDKLDIDLIKAESYVPPLEDMAKVVCVAYKLGMSPDLQRLFSRLDAEAQHADRRSIADRFMPFLEYLTQELEETCQNGLQAPVFQSLYLSIIKSCILKSNILGCAWNGLQSKKYYEISVEKECQELKACVRKLDGFGGVKKLLGKHYDDIMQLRPVSASAAGALEKPNSTESPTRSTVPSKGKAATHVASQTMPNATASSQSNKRSLPSGTTNNDEEARRKRRA